MRLTKLDEADGVPLLGLGHEIVSLDAKAGDYATTRGVFQEVKKLQDFLRSETAKTMDIKIRNMLTSYLESKMKTMTQKHFMDALNLDTEAVARDITLKMEEDQRRTGVEHIIQTMLSIEKNGGSPGGPTPPVDASTMAKLVKLLGSAPGSGDNNAADDSVSDADGSEYDAGEGDSDDDEEEVMTVPTRQKMIATQPRHKVAAPQLA